MAPSSQAHSQPSSLWDLGLVPGGTGSREVRAQLVRQGPQSLVSSPACLAENRASGLGLRLSGSPPCRPRGPSQGARTEGGAEAVIGTLMAPMPRACSTWLLSVLHGSALFRIRPCVLVPVGGGQVPCGSVLKSKKEKTGLLQGDQCAGQRGSHVSVEAGRALGDR